MRNFLIPAAAALALAFSVSVGVAADKITITKVDGDVVTLSNGKTMKFNDIALGVNELNVQQCKDAMANKDQSDYVRRLNENCVGTWANGG